MNATDAANDSVEGAPSEAGFGATVPKSSTDGATTRKDGASLADLFDGEQMQIFYQTDRTPADLLTIARIEDKVQRDEVVNLLISGMPTVYAVEEILGDAAPARNSGKAKEKTKVTTDPNDSMTDDEWYETYCSEKAAMFKKPAKFKSDAILYRLCRDARYAFRAECKKRIAKAKKDGGTGPLYYLFNRFISLAHPKDWYICGACRGTGDSPRGGQCEKCYGACYIVMTETYL
jgi:hypothetical protein